MINCLLSQFFWGDIYSHVYSGLVAGVYTTNSAEAVFHVLDSSNANIVVVDDSKQLEKIKEIKHRLPNLKAAVQLYGPYEPYIKREDGYYRVCIEFFPYFQLFVEFRSRFRLRIENTFGIHFYYSGRKSRNLMSAMLKMS